MNTTQAMTWQIFKEQLEQYPELALQFQYGQNQWVDAAYHITEIKLAPITSVDCGGVLNKWTEMIVQLWEPEKSGQEGPMSVNKALSIVAVVEKSLPLDRDGIVKIEFGNSEFDTRQMFPNNISVQGNNLLVDLRPDAVQCKAITRGGSCGTTESGEECCAPADKPKIQLINLAAPNAPSCTPGSGCC